LFEEETGECGERQLNHSDGEAERFYRDLQKRGIRVRVGMGVRLYWMWRNGCEYSPSLEFGSYAGELGTGHGVQ
jgi:hypothetical protein